MTSMISLTVASKLKPSMYFTPYCSGILVQHALRSEACRTSDDVTICAH